MKTRFRIFLSAAVAIPLLIAGSAAALQGPSGGNTAKATSNSVSSPDKVEAATETETETHAADDNLTLQQRLDKRKAELKIKLTAAEQQRIGLKCKASQGALSSLKGRITGIETSRSNVYRELAERLTKLSDKLKSQGADTASLQAELDTLEAKITTFKTDLATYKLAVSDLSAMDCAKDPPAFKASLEAARAARLKVGADSIDIRKYVNETIKPTLQQLRKQLEGTKDNGGNQ